MKRYVKEFANDVLNRPYSNEKKSRIQRAVHYCEKGMITDFEAIKMIVRIITEWQEEENND